MTKGDIIYVKSGGRLTSKVVVNVLDGVVYACSVDEYNQAVHEGRQPHGVPYWSADIVRETA